MGSGEARHVPVLAEETLEQIGVVSHGVYCDATAGGGGFSQQLIDRLTTGKLVAMDRDARAVEALAKRWAGDARVEVVLANFAGIERLWKTIGLPAPLGIIYDLGISSLQLDDPAYGMSFQADAPLDMRMDTGGNAPTAAELLACMDGDELEKLFFRFGEASARRIARVIVRERAVAPIETTGRLAAIVAGASRARGPRHPATKVFLALRATVNRELEAVGESLHGALNIIAPGGRLAVISYHSLEDVIVKDIFRRACKGCSCKLPPDECRCEGRPVARYTHRGVITPAAEEMRRNPRSRSAKLRVVERI